VLACELSTVSCRSPSARTVRWATHGSGAAVPAGPVQSAAGCPSRNTVIESVATPAGNAVASIVNTSRSGCAVDSCGAVINSSLPKYDQPLGAPEVGELVLVIEMLPPLGVVMAAISGVASVAPVPRGSFVIVPSATAVPLVVPGAVADSLRTRPPTVAPAPIEYVLAMSIGPSASAASDEAGTVAVQVLAPDAGAETVWPAESISVTLVALAPG
jgi:hypothetical protein